MVTPISLSVPVRVKPGAARPRVGGRHDGPYGPAVVVAVHAPAVDGRATEAARRALAQALGVRPGHVTLRSGAVSRDKLFVVTLSAAAGGAELADRVTALRESSGP
jgi:uncharacterized protein